VTKQPLLFLPRSQIIKNVPKRRVLVTVATVVVVAAMEVVVVGETEGAINGTVVVFHGGTGKQPTAMLTTPMGHQKIGKNKPALLGKKTMERFQVFGVHFLVRTKYGRMANAKVLVNPNPQIQTGPLLIPPNVAFVPLENFQSQIHLESHLQPWL
jgi:hypothetical protein